MHAAGPASSASHLSVLNGEGNITYVKATPAQFHFHSTSEHVVSGTSFTLTMDVIFMKLPPLPGTTLGKERCSEA